MRRKAETCKKYSAIVLIKIDFALFLPPSIFKVLMSCFFMARFLIQESVKIRKGHGKKKFFYKTQKGRSVQSKVSKMFLNYTYLVSDLAPGRPWDVKSEVDPVRPVSSLMDVHNGRHMDVLWTSFFIVDVVWTSSGRTLDVHFKSYNVCSATYD